MELEGGFWISGVLEGEGGVEALHWDLETSACGGRECETLEWSHAVIWGVKHAPEVTEEVTLVPGGSRTVTLRPELGDMA